MTGKYAPIDISELLEIMDNDNDLMQECFDDFLSDYSEILYHIKSAIEGREAESLQMHSHTLKGSLKYLAAGPAADVAGKLEEIGRSGQMDNAEEIFKNLEQECERIREFMTRS